MRVSLSWLQEYVRIDVPLESLAEKLSMSGTKVEGIHRPGGDVTGVVVAEVKAIEQHPNADNLTLVDVELDAGSTQRVVCGARNFAVGDRVPYAGIGARLPEMEIKRRRIRGETSAGMLCSAAELGISKDHSGILVLSPEASLGADVVEVLGLDDTIVELEITPNRPDCTGMIGIAREVAALLGTELVLPDASVAESGGAAGVEIDVADPAGCPRYLARRIEGVSIGPSPAWMTARLMAAGIRPVSNVVDTTNYVMLETAQPLHAFDASAIRKQRIVVRRAARGEKLETLDGVERSLSTDDLLIADPKQALAIAGVMGGLASEVSGTTTTVILEAAYFDPESVALTARRHLLFSEASYRFEWGVDPEGVPFAAARAARLITEVAGGSTAPALDRYPAPVDRARITLRPARTDHVLGVATPPDVQASLLRSVGIQVAESNGSLDAGIPTFRPDIRREEDLIEEVARLAGLERLPATLPPGKAGGLDARLSADRLLRRTLVGLGLHEAWTTALIAEKDLDDLGLPAGHPARTMVAIENPMSEDENRMRTTMLPGLLRSAALSFAHRAEGVALFELARVYEPGPDLLPHEPAVLGALFSGEQGEVAWARPGDRWDFWSAKGVLEAACEGCGAGSLRFETATGMPFHPTRAAGVYLGVARLGALGELHPKVCERFGVPEQTIVFEVAPGPLYSARTPRRIVVELGRYPALLIDMAVVVDDATPAASVESLIHEAGAPELVSVTLFDLYRGEQIPTGKKSLAYALRLQAPDRTFTDEDAVAVRDRIMKALSERAGAE